MTTKIQHFCDKCGTESREPLPAYGLWSRYGGGSTPMTQTRDMELCMKCRESLLDAIEKWGLPSSYDRERRKQSAPAGSR